MLLKTVLFVFFATTTHAGRVNETEAIIQICNTNNATDKVEQVKILMDEYIECHPKMVNFTQLAADFNEAQNGTVDDVAKKSCAKAAQTKTCMAKINTAVALCAKIDQKDLLFGLEISRRGIDYLCYEEDGRTRLAKFVDEGGIQCFSSRPASFSRCAGRAPPGMKNMSRCLIDELKACSNPAALLAQNMFDYILN